MEPLSLNPENLEKIIKIGGEPLLKKLIAIFLERIPLQIASILQHQMHERWKDIGDIAHSIRSSAGNLGAEKLFFYTQELEKESKSQNVPKINEWIREIQTEFSLLQKKLAQEMIELE